MYWLIAEVEPPAIIDYDDEFEFIQEEQKDYQGAFPNIIFRIYLYKPDNAVFEGLSLLMKDFNIR